MIIKSVSILSLLAATAVAVSPTVFAAGETADKAESAAMASPSPAAESSAKKLTAHEKLFIKKASGGNLAEVKLGELAQKNGESQAVKDFGEKMVTDHGKANTDLQAVATKEGVEFAPALNAMSQKTYDHLSHLTGAAFDKAYVADMLKDHIKDESEYKLAIESIKNDDLKDYANTTLPVIQSHLTMVKQMKEGMTTAKTPEKKS